MSSVPLTVNLPARLTAPSVPPLFAVVRSFVPLAVAFRVGLSLPIAKMVKMDIKTYNNNDVGKKTISN